MTCSKCENQINSGDKICKNCGSKIGQTNQKNINESQDAIETKKRSVIDLILWGIRGKKESNFRTSLLVAIIFIVGMIILGIWLSKSGELVYGTWNCNSDTTLVLSKNKKFEMYNTNNRDKLNIIGKFTLNKTKQEISDLKYTLTLTTNDRIVSGEKLTDTYTTKYELTMKTTNQQNMNMINTIIYSMYSCEKVR